MSWTVTETDQLDPQAVDRQGNKFLVGNGYLGYRGTLEEYTREQKVAVIVAGLYDQVGDQWREPVNLPNGGYLRASYQGQPLHALTSRRESHTQTLDLYRGLHVRRTVFLTDDGNKITVAARRFLSLAQPHLFCLQYQVEAARSCTLSFEAGIDGEVWDLNGPHLEAFSAVQSGELIALSARTHEQGVRVVVTEALLGAGPAPACRQEPQRILRTFSLALTAGQPQTLTKFVAFHTDRDGSGPGRASADPICASADPVSAAQATCQAATNAGFDRLLEEHSALWAARWQRCDIQIEGDAEAQAALRFSLYHLLAIAPTHASDVSIPARGLSGQVYKGAIFWDTEIFMLPFFSHTFPALARNLLLYRYHTLDGARRKAQAYGFRGAFYAWESQDTGDDACTLFNVTDVFTQRPMRTYFRDKQYHISADIVYAFWRYYALTGDDRLWLEGGAEVVYECARFFLSSLYYRPEKRRYEMLDVTGPDEYHERVHNNAYTNWLIAHTFEVCLKVSAHLQAHYPALAAQLLDRLDFRTDLAVMSEVLPRFYQPAPEPAAGPVAGPASDIIPQFDGYFELEDVSLADLLGRKLHPHEYLGGGNGLATTTQILKQADVILGLYLLGDTYSPAVKAANWEYYEPRTEHGSSLSACSYSMIAAQIGKVDWAYRYFLKTATIDLTGDSKQYVGPLYIGGTHPAANGGAWLAAVCGLCGVSSAEETLVIRPRLPQHWTRVSLPLTFRGQPLLITLTQAAVTVQAVSPVATQVQVQIGEQVAVLPAAQPLTLPWHPEAVTA